MQEFGRHADWNSTGFGSMLDWVLVFTLDEDMVVVNMNAELPQLRKVCFVVSDDYGRSGYFVVDELFEMIEDLKENDGWDAYYNSP